MEEREDELKDMINKVKCVIQSAQSSEESKSKTGNIFKILN